MQFNIIGAGKLGLALASVLQSSGQHSLAAICNRSLESARRSCEILGFGKAVSNLTELPEAEIVFLTVNDDNIAFLVEELARAQCLNPGTLVFHCSGVLSSAVLAPLQALGCKTASFHPLKAFRSGDLQPSLHNIYCTVEGEPKACDWAKTVFTEVGAKVLELAASNKAAYHAAACMASNYVITLASACESLFLQAGLTKEESFAISINQMQGALDNLRQTGSMKKALTGPLLRGDSKTIGLHLQAMQDRVLKSLYKTAAEATLSLTDLPFEKKQAIQHVLITE